MRLIVFANNYLGWKLTEYLQQESENIVGLVVHPTRRAKHTEKILNCVPSLKREQIFTADKLDEPGFEAFLNETRPDLGLCLLFGYLLSPKTLSYFPKGVINVHPALLPFNRGSAPNVWSIVEETPIGATIHYIDEGIDTGDIVSQRAVEVEPIDTGETLYKKVETTTIQLFRETWPKIRSGSVEGQKQAGKEGSYHNHKALFSLDKIDLNQTYRAKDLLNVLRARTFPPHESAYFEENGKKVYIEVNLRYADEKEDNQ